MQRDHVVDGVAPCEHGRLSGGQRLGDLQRRFAAIGVNRCIVNDGHRDRAGVVSGHGFKRRRGGAGYVEADVGLIDERVAERIADAGNSGRHGDDHIELDDDRVTGPEEAVAAGRVAPFDEIHRAGRGDEDGRVDGARNRIKAVRRTGRIAGPGHHRAGDGARLLRLLIGHRQRNAGRWEGDAILQLQAIDIVRTAVGHRDRVVNRDRTGCRVGRGDRCGLHDRYIARDRRGRPHRCVDGIRDDRLVVVAVGIGGHDVVGVVRRRREIVEIAGDGADHRLPWRHGDRSEHEVRGHAAGRQGGAVTADRRRHQMEARGKIVPEIDIGRRRTEVGQRDLVGDRGVRRHDREGAPGRADDARLHAVDRGTKRRTAQVF